MNHESMGERLPWEAHRTDATRPGRVDLPTASLVGLALGSLSGAKVVHKHWGREYWIVPEGAPFGFKVICINAGCRTSLQFHRQKEEANIILSGEGTLRFGDGVNDAAGEIPVAPGVTVHVRSGAVHRFSAITDMVMIEVSTPELDDVVRITDDKGRPDGRIEAEHDPMIAARREALE